MHSASKWIEDADPQQLASEIAKRALASRFETVLYYMPLAATKHAEDIEHVHQLRVATRRARAAQQIFADFLPRRRRRVIQKQMRRLRRAAGDARDLDVLAQRLREIVDQQQGSRLARVIPQVAARRRNAQKPLVDACKKLRKKGFAQKLQAAADRVRWRREGDEPRFAQTAEAAMRPLVSDFFESAADLSDAESLHRMRLSAKRVRYAMELLGGAFDDSFRSKLYPIFEKVQERLGLINDHATAKRLFSRWTHRAKGKSARNELVQLVAQEEDRLDAASREFRDWWTEDRSTELLREFEQSLAGAAGAEPPRSGPETPPEAPPGDGGPHEQESRLEEEGE